jgi:hypothetical protein
MRRGRHVHTNVTDRGGQSVGSVALNSSSVARRYIIASLIAIFDILALSPTRI